jgi:hypothetical protein
LWLPVATVAVAPTCAYVFGLVEGTVHEARKLRGMMYAHKRA